MRAARLGDGLDAPAELLARHLEALRPAARTELAPGLDAGDGGGEQPAVAEDAHLVAREDADPARNLRAVVTETSSVPRMESPATSGAALAAIPVDEPARAISRPEPAVRSSIVTTPRLPTSCRMRAWTPRLVAIAWVRRGSEAT